MLDKLFEAIFKAKKISLSHLSILIRINILKSSNVPMTELDVSTSVSNRLREVSAEQMTLKVYLQATQAMFILDEAACRGHLTIELSHRGSNTVDLSYDIEHPLKEVSGDELVKLAERALIPVLEKALLANGLYKVVKRKTGDLTQVLDQVKWKVLLSQYATETQLNFNQATLRLNLADTLTLKTLLKYLAIMRYSKINLTQSVSNLYGEKTKIASYSAGFS